MEQALAFIFLPGKRPEPPFCAQSRLFERRKWGGEPRGAVVHPWFSGSLQNRRTAEPRPSPGRQINHVPGRPEGVIKSTAFLLGFRTV